MVLFSSLPAALFFSPRALLRLSGYFFAAGQVKAIGNEAAAGEGGRCRYDPVDARSW